MKVKLEGDIKPDLAWKFEAILRKCCSKPMDEENKQHFAWLLMELGIDALYSKMFGEDKR